MEPEIETEDREEMIEVLQNVETGDDLTVKTEENWGNKYVDGYKDHRKVVHVDKQSGLIQFGDAMKSGKLIDPDTAEIGNIPDVEEKLPTWIEISKLWKW